jgi:predicted RNase H-like HicB family nuclease
MKVLIIVEPTDTGFSAHSPDVPGCVATGPDRETVEREMRDAIAFHLKGLRAEGYPVPELRSYATYVEVAAAG